MNKQNQGGSGLQRIEELIQQLKDESGPSIGLIRNVVEFIINNKND